MSKDYTLLDTLSNTKRGESWLQILPKECIDALRYIDDKLAEDWSRGVICPTKIATLLPFHMIAPEEVKLVILCKEPYSNSNMATGIPVDSGGTLETYSEKVFSKLISEYWNNVDKHNFMKCYYASGIMVINSAFTNTCNSDKRYPLSTSHFPLWTRFCQPFVKYINSMNIHVVGLGVESRGLMRNLPNVDYLHSCTFPIDQRSSNEFMSILKNIINHVIFQTNRTL